MGDPPPQESREIVCIALDVAIDMSASRDEAEVRFEEARRARPTGGSSMLDAATCLAGVVHFGGPAVRAVLGETCGTLGEAVSYARVLQLKSTVAE